MNGEFAETDRLAAGQLGALAQPGVTASGTRRSAGRPPDARRQERRRTEILKAATRIFAAAGFAATDVQEIASEAGVGKGTVYRYFPSKEELFLAAVDQGVRRLAEMVEAEAATAPNPLARITSAVRAYLTYFDLHPEMVELFIQERAHFRSRQRSTYFVHRDANIGPWRELLGELVRDGLVRDLPPDTVLDALSDLLYGALFTKHFSGRQAPLASQADGILEVILRGILVQPGSPVPRPQGAAAAGDTANRHS